MALQAIEYEYICQKRRKKGKDAPLCADWEWQSAPSRCVADLRLIADSGDGYYSVQTKTVFILNDSKSNV